MCRLTFKEWGLYWDRLNAAVESQDSERIYAAKIAVKNDIRRIYIERYDRDEATTILRCEPYKTVSLLGFSMADKIAMSLGEDADSVRRMHAATVEAQKRACARTGNMCAEQDAIKAQLQILTPEVSSEVMDKAIVEVAQTYDIVKQGKYYYDKSDFLTERKMAAKIAELACVKPSKEAEIEKAFIEWQQENSMILSPRQAEAVRNLKYRISIVTGGPGTGKTTCLRAIMDVYHKVWPSEHILLMAPTGLAAKRMAESTKTNSATIHKACCLVPADNNSGFVAQSECRICGFVGIDEMSMVGEHLFAFAIDAVLNSPSTRIVLLGDTDQLAPVSRGDVLRDLIQCGVIKTVRLDVNYRQGSTSTITDASIKIRENRAYSGMTRNLKFDDGDNPSTKREKATLWPSALGCWLPFWKPMTSMACRWFGAKTSRPRRSAMCAMPMKKKSYGTSSPPQTPPAAAQTCLGPKALFRSGSISIALR